MNYSRSKSDPYKIIKVHTNGTVAIAQDTNYEFGLNW